MLYDKKNQRISAQSALSALPFSDLKSADTALLSVLPVATSLITVVEKSNQHKPQFGFIFAILPIAKTTYKQLKL